MRCWRLIEYGKPLILNKCNYPVLQNSKDVMVKVHAVGVNPMDYRMASGFGRRIFSSPPKILGRDFSGIVVYTGLSQKRLKVGDEVCGSLSPFESGTFCEYIVVDDNNIVLKPHHMSLLQAACFPYATLTIWNSVHYRCFGSNVLIIGANGGIGHLLMQIARSNNARNVYAVCSKRSADFVKKFKPDGLLFYDDDDFEEKFSHLSKINLVIDLSGKYFDKCLPIMSKGATYVTAVSPVLQSMDDLGIVCGNVSSLFYKVGCDIRSIAEQKEYKWAFYKSDLATLQTVADFFALKDINVSINKVFDFENLNDALQTLKNRYMLDGKIAVRVTPGSD